MKVKSLSLSRKTQTPPRKEESANPNATQEDGAHVPNLDSVLSSPIARPSLTCSTPIKKNVELVEDSPDQDYRGSPTSLYPCTQDSNEIAWDWQCAANKNNETNAVDVMNKNNAALNNTPKRPQQFLQKKRMTKAYSPLLNVSSKRKLAKQDVAESISKFAAELKALADELQNAQADDNNENDNREEIAGDIAPSTSKQAGIHDMETQNVFDIHEASTLEISYVKEPRNDSEKPDSSLDDLFDDSVDACMVQCSQEVENKLKLGSETAEIKPVQNLSNHEESRGRKINCGASTSYSNHNTGAKKIQNKSDDTIRIEKLFPEPFSKEKTSSKILPNCSKSSADNDVPASQIPDDSFDDCLAFCLDEDDDLLSKFLEDKKLEETALEKSKPPSSSSNQVFNIGSNFKRKQQCLGSDSAAATPQNRKFFKVKSLSDSHYVNSGVGRDEKLNINGPNLNPGRNYPSPISKSTSNYNLSSKNGGNEVRNKVYSTPNLNNSISAAGGRNNAANKQATGNTVSYSYLRTNNNNLAENAFGAGNRDFYANTAGPEKPLNELRTTLPTSSQQSRCTPGEIEKKRLEAKMRLEANKRMKQTNSNKSIVGVNLPIKRPVNRR